MEKKIQNQSYDRNIDFISRFKNQRYYHIGIFLPFWSLGQGPVEFGKMSFKPSKLENLMLSK